MTHDCPLNFIQFILLGKRRLFNLEFINTVHNILNFYQQFKLVLLHVVIEDPILHQRIPRLLAFTFMVIVDIFNISTSCASIATQLKYWHTPTNSKTNTSVTETLPSYILCTPISVSTQIFYLLPQSVPCALT